MLCEGEGAAGDWMAWQCHGGTMQHHPVTYHSCGEDEREHSRLTSQDVAPVKTWHEMI